MLRVQETLEPIMPQEVLDLNRLKEALTEAFWEFEKRVMRSALEEMKRGV